MGSLKEELGEEDPGSCAHINDFHSKISTHTS